MIDQANEFLDWNGSFIAEESSYKLLEPGIFPFKVTKMDRKIYDGQSDKIPNGAPYAEISIEVTSPEGSTIITDRLFLMKSWQWKLTQFFSAIGQAPIVGQPFTPNWNMVLGATGKVEIEINKYISRGEERKNNRVKEYKESEGNAPQQQNQQTFNQNHFAQNNQQQTQSNNWSSGSSTGQGNQQQQNNWSNPGAF